MSALGSDVADLCQLFSWSPAPGHHYGLRSITTVPVTSQMNSLLQTEGRGEGRDTDIEVGTDTDMDERGQIMVRGCRGCGDGDGAFS